MAQESIPNQDNKQTGDSLSAAEFNSLNNAINNNAGDADTRFVDVETTQVANGDRITLIEGAPSIPSYQEHNLPTTNIAIGSLAYNSTHRELVYFKNNQWFRVKDNGGIILVSGFAFVVDTTLLSTDSDHTGTSTNTQFTMPFVDTGVYNCTIDWDAANPGTDTQNVTTPGRITHDYAAPGQYTISITGVIEGFSFDDYDTTYANDSIESANKIIEIKNFGSLTFVGGNSNNNHSRAGDAFMNCYNMDITAPDVPDTSGTTDFLHMFRKCISMTNVPLLDFTTGNRWWGMFYNCLSITSLPDLNFNNGEVRNPSAFYEVFRNCTSLTTLDNVTFADMGSSVNHLFRGCSSLTSIPTSCDFTNVSDFSYFMRNCQLVTEFPQYAQITNGTAFVEAWLDCALTATAIENILGALVTNGRSNLNTSFAGGTNAGKSTWSATANTYYDTLVLSRGWTIDHNP